MSTLDRFAALVVDVLHVGERKADRLASEVCRTFGIDLDELLGQPGGFIEANVARTKATVLSQLVERCPDAETLLRVFVSSGVHVVAMLDEIYRFLADQTSTTSGTSESFVFNLRSEELDITLSEAFFEQLRELTRSVLHVEVGDIDTEQLRLLLGTDNGESYGSFPTAGEGRPLLHEVMLLRPIRSKLEERAVTDDRWVATFEVHDRAAAAADGLVRRLEDLLHAFAADVISSADEQPDGEEGASQADLGREQREVERTTLVTNGVVGGPVPADLFDELDEATFVGVRVVDESGHLLARPYPMRTTDLVDRHGHVVSGLGNYVGLVRGGFTLAEDRWSAHFEERGEGERVVTATDPDDAIAWLEGVADAAEAATVWVDDGLWQPTGVEDSVAEIERIADLLRLPLWRERHLLFEIWLLCRSVRAAASAGWTSELIGLDDRTWLLPQGRTESPVVLIRRGATSLSIWREPNRGVTPDLTITTQGLLGHELVVIEAKDRHPMHTGIGPDGSLSSDAGTATGAAVRYVQALGAQLTWVCNHSPSKGASPDPSENIGTPWHRVHLAAEFGPGTVPEAFDSTIADVLSSESRGAGRQFILILDTTGSMHEAASSVGEALGSVPADSFDRYAALLFGDHGDASYVVHPVDWYRSPDELWAAVVQAGQTHGGDAPEALEDAMYAARLTSTGPGTTFVVVTDARPHPPDECPLRLDFAMEVTTLLQGGASVWVVTDFLGDSVDVWDPFRIFPQFRFVELNDVAASLTPS